VNDLRSRHPLVILSDTYYEFAAPLMQKLDWPILFCNTLETDAEGNVVNYRLRLRDGKKFAVRHFRELNFTVIAGGDSYNDTAMLAEADYGILFRPSERVCKEFPQFPVTTTYPEMDRLIREFAGR